MRSSFVALIGLAALCACRSSSSGGGGEPTPAEPRPHRPRENNRENPRENPRERPNEPGQAVNVPPEPNHAPTGKKPNIVFVLADDFSTNLVQYMPNVQAMEKEGVSFSHYIVSNSFCCPSRSTIFTGKFPHNTGVITNNGQHGGYGAFVSNGNEHSTFALSLQQAGYKTAMLGKYLNGYETRTPPQPGWTDWYVAGEAYKNFDYTLNENGTEQRYGNEPKDYLTDVIAGFGLQFVKRSQPAGPFFIELASFAPHKPYTPAPRDENSFADIHTPRTPAFGARPNAAAPAWLKDIAPLGPKRIERMDGIFRKRVQSVQAIDKMVGELRAALAALHDEDTYVIFSSDNGLHIGEYGLHPGKQTPYDIDVRVPLVIVGPGLPKGHVVDALVQNTDLCSTFIELAGASQAPTAPDGRSIVPLLHGSVPSDWRQVTYIEHEHAGADPKDPDGQGHDEANPPTYSALRSHETLYVEYDGGDLEYHDLARDPDEVNNTFQSLPQERKAKLHAAMEAIKTCKGAEACTAAMKVAP